MERPDVLELMSTLKLYGMRAAYDEVMATGLKRRHEPPRFGYGQLRRGSALREEVAGRTRCRNSGSLCAAELRTRRSPPV